MAQAAATAAQGYQESSVSTSTQAQAYLADTQTARNEAVQCLQNFQSTLDNIYTKQECHNQFAHNLEVDTGIGCSHEIYPNPGSQISVTAYGHMNQLGNGTPSPSNIRPFNLGGLKRVQPEMNCGEAILLIQHHFIFP